MSDITRRDVFRTGAFVAMGAVAGGCAGTGASGGSRPGAGLSARDGRTDGECGGSGGGGCGCGGGGRDPEHTWGHTRPFGDEYYANLLPIFEAVRASEMPVIDEVASRMAATIQSGGTVWYQAKQGHMPRFEFDMANRGNPGIFQSNSEWDDTDYDKMRPGDMLVTNYVNENVRAAREKGVYIVEITVSYQDQPGFPRGYIVPSPLGIMQKDLADAIVDSHTPYEQGLVRCPQIPELWICPSSGNLLTALFWAFQTEAAARLRNGDAPGAHYAALYLDTVVERIKAAYAGGRDAIFAAAPEIARRIGNGAHFHMTSDHGGVQCEATGTASGPMMTNAFRKEPRAGDVHLLTTIEPDSPAILEEAESARGMGMYIVAVGPAGSTRLAALADVFVDNHCPEGGGLIEVPGWPERIGTAAGIVNNTLNWCLTAQFVDEMVRRGWIPWFWMGYYRVGGAEYNEAVRPLFLRQGF